MTTRCCGLPVSICQSAEECGNSVVIAHLNDLPESVGHHGWRRHDDLDFCVVVESGTPPYTTESKDFCSPASSLDFCSFVPFFVVGSSMPTASRFDNNAVTIRSTIHDENSTSIAVYRIKQIRVLHSQRVYLSSRPTGFFYARHRRRQQIRSSDLRLGLFFFLFSHVFVRVCFALSGSTMSMYVENSTRIEE